MSEIVIYNGRAVPKEGFRTFVYGINDTSLLVESWDEYLSNISSGIWYPTKEQAPQPVVELAPAILGLLEKTETLEDKKTKKRGE